MMDLTLTINGSEKTFSATQRPGSIADLLRHLQIDNATVVAEIDGQIIERMAFGHTLLQNGQRIELIRFVGGG